MLGHSKSILSKQIAGVDLGLNAFHDAQNAAGPPVVAAGLHHQAVKADRCRLVFKDVIGAKVPLPARHNLHGLGV